MKFTTALFFVHTDLSGGYMTLIQCVAERQKLFFIIQLTIKEQNWEIINVYHSI